MKTIKTLLPRFIFVLASFMLAGYSTSIAANVDFSNYFRNLSSNTNLESLDVRHPEQIIVGNTIHTMWLEYNANVENNVYYRRSLDLGKSWEETQLILRVKSSAGIHSAFSRIMSVSNQTVHICIPDYDYSANGTGYLYYFRSKDNGASFEDKYSIAVTGGGYNKFTNSIIKSVGNKLAIAYQSEKDGLHLLISENNGDTFKDTIAVKKTAYYSSLVDMHYDGTQIILLHQYTYYQYGFNIGRVYVTVSNDKAGNFVTHKISEKYATATDSVERSIVNYKESNFRDYDPHIAVSDKHVYILFEQWESPNWSCMYAHSRDKGETFEKAISLEDTNSAGNTFPVMAATKNYLYIATKNGTSIRFKVSTDYGDSFSDAKTLFTSSFCNDSKAPERYQLKLDPNDESGTTVHVIGNTHFAATSTDGGLTFPNIITYSNHFNNMSMNTDMEIDAHGVKHWFIIHKPNAGTYADLYYRQTGSEPQPGIVNKAWEIKKAKGINTISLAMAESPTLHTDSAISIGVWLKFHPERTGSSPIFRKMKNNTSFNDYAVNGNHIAYRVKDKKINIYSALKTDNGEFLSISKKTITDSLWHYISYTYDANGDLNNFKVYIDGIIDDEQSVSGEIDDGDGIIFLGPSVQGNLNTDLDYQMDNFKIWNKALTKDEIQSEMNKTNTEADPSLKVFLNFDDTFKDMSGNGNDGIPMLMVENVASNFDPPLTNFDIYHALSEVSLNNKTQNGVSYLWDFGNKDTNTQPNPKYNYSIPGEYSITLRSENANSVTSLSKSVSIKGLEKVLPTSAGNKGTITLDVYGGGLSTANTSIWLRKQGQADVAGEGIYDVGTGIVQTKVNLKGLALGVWDVVVKEGAAEQTLKDAFTIKEAQESAPWVSLAGRRAVLLNRWQTFTINYGNKGNVDAYSVPIWLSITEAEQLEVEFLDFKMELPEYWQENPLADDMKALGKYFVTDSVDNINTHVRVYPFMIPVIRANSTASLRIRVKTPKNMELSVWTNPAWLSPEDIDSPQRVRAQNEAIDSNFDPGCVVKTLGMGVLDATTAVLPDVGCVWGGIKIAHTVYNHATAKANEKPSIWNTIWNVGLSVTDCGVSLAKNAAFPIKWGIACINLVNAAYDIRNCYLPKNQDDKKVKAVSSFDPNEMIGPNGFGEQNWIQPQNVIPYTILYENKNTATAPAHTVIVVDTLDTSTFDLSDFSFGAFGWGDTLINLQQTKLREFSVDVDLRPKKELIARVSAKLDSIKGIVSWEILSLNPITMDEEEDPFLGFLPPNNAQHQGEGFVTFAVALKSDLASNYAVKNKASIVFDANAPIVTNEYVNMLDLQEPMSSVSSLQAVSANEIIVNWGGSDAGSGVKSYSIWVQKGDETPEEWLFNSTETSAVYIAEPGFEYKFYSLATDNVNRRELKTNQFDAQLFFSSIKTIVLPTEKLSLYPNPAKDIISIKLENAPYVGEYVMECFGMNGVKCFRRELNASELRNGLDIAISELAKGEYIIRILYADKTLQIKFTVR